MDADVALHNFTDVPYVIERPAEPNALADAAVAILAKSGLRMEFGTSATTGGQHDVLVSSDLPLGFGLMSRQTGRILGAVAPFVIVAGPSRVSEEKGSPDPAQSMAHQTWTMTSYALKGTDRNTALAFASLMGIRSGAGVEVSNYCASRQEAWDWGGPGRGFSSDMIRKVEALRGKIETKGGLRQYSTNQVSAMAEGLAGKLSMNPAAIKSVERIKLMSAKLAISAAQNGIDYKAWASSHSNSPAIARHLTFYGEKSATVVSAAFAPDSDDLQSYLVNASIEGDVISRAALGTGANELHFDHLAARPQLGSPSPGYASIKPDRPRFEIKLSQPIIGPSFLPQDLFKLSSVKTAQWVHADLLKVVMRAKEISKTAFELVPGTGGVRSELSQAKLKKAGRSQAKIARHTIGNAVDLVPVDGDRQPDFGNRQGFDDIRDAMQIAAEELNIPIQWGGNWKMVDKPHFELDRKVYPSAEEEPDAENLLVAFR